jgi:hypothetical protein
VANNRFTWPGLEEIKAQLRALPVELVGEGGHIVEGRGNGAAATIKAGYPSRTHELIEKLEVEFTASAFGARSVIRNTSRHAAAFENGSEVRHTALGWNRGRMPPNHLFTQTIIRARRAMYEDLADLLERKGLRVTGRA